MITVTEKKPANPVDGDIHWVLTESNDWALAEWEENLKCWLFFSTRKKVDLSKVKGWSLEILPRPHTH